jgi:hypothetical protein
MTIGLSDLLRPVPRACSVIRQTELGEISLLPRLLLAGELSPKAPAVLDRFTDRRLLLPIRVQALARLKLFRRKNRRFSMTGARQAALCDPVSVAGSIRTPSPIVELSEMVLT